MTLDPAAIGLVRGHLEAGVDQLERDAKDGRFNTLCIRALGNAAMLLGVAEIAARALCLLRAAPDRAFWAGAITNIELPQAIPDRMRELDPPEALSKRHPCYQDAELINRIRSYARDEEHLALCLEGRFQEARVRAGSGRRLEEVGDTLAVLGEFSSALSVYRDPALEAFRQQGVLFVVVIELSRRGRLAEADTLLAESGTAELGTWERVHLALGSGGREPWAGYPYPDW